MQIRHGCKSLLCTLLLTPNYLHVHSLPETNDLELQNEKSPQKKTHTHTHKKKTKKTHGGGLRSDDIATDARKQEPVGAGSSSWLYIDLRRLLRRLGIKYFLNILICFVRSNTKMNDGNGGEKRSAEQLPSHINYIPNAVAPLKWQ